MNHFDNDHSPSISTTTEPGNGSEANIDRIDAATLVQLLQHLPPGIKYASTRVSLGDRG